MDKNILIVEDSLDYIKMLKKLLNDNGYLVTTANSGEEGIEKLKNNNNEPIDIIITDLHMPGISGLDMAKEVFSKKISKAPIIILTTETSIELRKYGKKAGIHAWVIKPIHEEKFLETIDLIFQRYCKV